MSTISQYPSYLNSILSFLQEIGIEVKERELNESTFLPGLQLGPNCIYMDKNRLLYPGDLLHEAGHLAVTPAKQRRLIGTPLQEAGWPTDGEELGAILWSFAALTHIGLPVEVVFHPKGYKNEADWLIENFRNQSYIGLPFLEWIGLTLGKEKALKEGKAMFPAMINWLRAA